MHEDYNMLTLVALRNAQLTLSRLPEELRHYLLGKPLVRVKLYERSRLQQLVLRFRRHEERLWPVGDI